MTKFTFLWIGAMLAALPTAGQPSPVLERADRMIAAAGAGERLRYEIDPALGHVEAFRISRAGADVRVAAGGPAGVLYGVQEVLDGHSIVDAEGAPDFDLRGAVLMMLSASWAYQSDLSPEVYPWFFDRPLMTRYLDHLLAARLNTLVLWSGHLFPHILQLPEYPDATQFSAEEIRRNQEQFRWLADECASRNITILTHFYNIHISEHLARALGRTGTEGHDATRYTEPDDFVRGYYRTILERYFAEFPNVGLYICPGESLALEHQKAWFRDVVFRVAEESGKSPKLIIRDWTMADDFRAALPSMYGNLYSELKHNDETITSPWPDLRHRTWKGVLKGHIINLHDPADAVPYRVGSPRLIGEMVRHWKDEGLFAGAWFYPPQCWVWPRTLDIVGEGDEGRKGLLTLERDEIWHVLEGRHLWRARRDLSDELDWTAEWLGRKFGGAEVGQLLVQWYDLTGPILPGLQNLTAVRFGNFFPTSVAWVQATVDDILSYRSRIDDPPLQGPTGLTRQRYYSRPVDAFTVEQYLAFFPDSGTVGERPGGGASQDLRTVEDYANYFGLRDLRSMPVAQFAEATAAGGGTAGYLLPDRLIETYLRMAERAREIARHAAALPSSDPAEVQRFVQDSECLVRTVVYYRHKILAALEKRLLELTGEAAHEAALREHMAASVSAYESLFTYAEKFYTKGTSMWDAKSWRSCFEEKVKPDLEQQMRWLDERRGQAPGTAQAR